jgi:hypothetical protein
MARILIAATPDDVDAMKRILGTRHELTAVYFMSEALKGLQNQEFELVMIGVHFNESRMFELLRNYFDTPKNANTPVICFSVHDTEMMRKMYLSINGACKALGAWMYLDPHHYNISEDPNSELLRIIERCLTDEERKATQANRVEIHKQREELLQLRLALEAEEWSLDLEDQVAQFRERLAEVLAELSDLQIDSIAQEEKITESTEKEDRVSEPVTQNEQAIDRAEIQIGLQESEQLGKEQKIVPQEEAKAKLGRRELADGQVEDRPVAILPINSPDIAK